MRDIEISIAIDPLRILNEMLKECLVCSEYFFENAALISDGDGLLSDEQIEKLIIMMSDFHLEH